MAVVEIVEADELWSRHHEAMPRAVEQLEAVVDRLLDEHGGERLDTYLAELAVCFERAGDAERWARRLLDAVRQLEAPVVLPIAVGMDVGVLRSRTRALSGRRVSAGPAVEAAARLARRGDADGLALSPMVADLLGRADAPPPGREVADPGPAATAVGPRTNLPEFSGRMHGRMREFNALADALDDARLAMVCGPGGAGKSRLAVEFSRAWLADRPEAEAWFCDLADVDSLDEALFRVARTTGIQIPTSEAAGELAERLGSALAGRASVLIILDDVDRLETLDAPVASWLDEAPGLRVIQTRKQLPESDAHVVQVDALGPASARALLESLLDRPRAATGRRADSKRLGELVDTSGRLPLALELIAGSARDHPDSLAARADAAPDSQPPDDSRRGGEQQDRLQQTLARSWEMLGPLERRALQVCTAFAESFTADAATALIEASVAQAVDVESPIDAAAAFAALRRYSLVRTSALPGDTGRHELLDPVRAFALAHADDALVERAARAHLRYFARWARELTDALEGDQESRHLDDARAELANLYRAADYGRGADASAWADVLVTLGEINVRIGPLGGFAERTDALVERARGEDAPELLLRALRLRALTRMWAGQYGDAEADSHEAWQLAEELGEDRLAVYALSDYGFTMGVQGNQEEGLALVRRTIEAIADDDSYEAITVLTNAAIVARNHGEVAEAVDYLHRALLRARRRKNAFAQASVLFLSSTILRHSQKWDEAERNLRESRALFGLFGDRRGRLLCYHELGECYTATGQFERAERCYREAMQLASSIGDREHTAVFRLGRGHSRFMRGDYALAEPDLLEAALAVEAVGHIHLEAGALLFLAATYAALERIAEARAYFERVEAIFEQTGITRERPMYRVLYGYLDAARGRGALRRGDVDEAEEWTRSAYRRSTTEGDPDPADATGAQREAEHLREFLDRCVEDGELPAVAAPHRAVLRVCEDLRWFAIDDEEPVDISRRGPIRRILRALVERRIERPGEPMDSDELLEAGWPDEVLTHQSATQRLHTTVSRMRSLGLQDALDTIDGAYLIAAVYSPVWVPRSA